MGYELECNEEQDLTLPKDSLHRARVIEVKVRQVNSLKRPGETFDVLNFWFEVTVPGDLGPEYIGRKVRGETFATLNSRPDCKLRLWGEALLGRKIPVGMRIDVLEDFIGLEAEILIGHRQDRNDPHKIYEEVADVIPLEENSGYLTGQDATPPF